MASIKTIRVRNLRALGDTGHIRLAPITVLVGKNSIGKSTFARIFPLVRQSVEVKRRAPILWWGKYVDFGTFEEAVNRKSSAKEIEFAFTIMLDRGNLNLLSPHFGHARRSMFLPQATEFIASINLVQGSQGTYISKICIAAHGLVCEMEINSGQTIDKISCGALEWVPASNTVGHVLTGEIFPDIAFSRPSAKSESGAIHRQLIGGSPLYAILQQQIINFVHGNTTVDRIRDIAGKMPLTSVEDALRIIKSVPGPTSWRVGVSQWTVNSPQLKRIREATLISSVPSLLQAFNSAVTEFGQGVRYLAPLRATAERYYRPQELSLEEIDSNGGNLAIFLNGLKDQGWLVSYNVWMKENLGLEVIPEKNGGQISLKVRFDGADATNLADMGFGLSQVLPVATQLWVSSTPWIRRGIGSGGGGTTCLVMEQPELHLHPAFQGKIADLLHGSLSRWNASGLGGEEIAPLCTVVETHSSALINRLGELVFEGKLKQSDIQILLFDYDESSGEVGVRKASFNNEGVLENWPFGFFSGAVGE